VRQLDQRRAAEHPLRALARVGGNRFPGGQVAHEVQRELHRLEIVAIEQRHAEHVGIEIDRDLGVAHAQHGLIHDETVGGGAASHVYPPQVLKLVNKRHVRGAPTL